MPAEHVNHHELETAPNTRASELAEAVFTLDRRVYFHPFLEEEKHRVDTSTYVTYCVE